MSLKLLLIIGLIAITIEAKNFLKTLHSKDLTAPFSSKFAEKSLNHLRKRRDTEAEKNETEEITDEDALSLLKFFVEAAWEGDKVGVLGGFLEELSDTDNNLTLVGWERILDDHGKVKEIRTIELVIPPKPDEDRATNIVQDDDDDEDDDEFLPKEELKELKGVLEPLSQLGIPASLTYEEFTDEGENEVLIYLDKDELYVHLEGFAVYNKTTVATPEEVSSFITSLKPAGLGKPSVLKFDVDGKLIVDQSNVRPQLLGYVIDHYEAPDNVLREAPSIIAQISQQYHQDEIPKQLAVHYNKAYSDFKWKVLVDPTNYYVTRDVVITLGYDNFELDENSDISYVVIGVKK